MPRSYFFPLIISSLTKAALKVVYFPLWWYGRGLSNCVRGVFSWLRGQSRAIGAWVWIRNLFVPMYGQRDIAGRAISFVIRLVQIVFRGLATIFLAFVSLVAVLVWLGLPIAVCVAIIWQIYG
jgi:hypothetical protein